MYMPIPIFLDYPEEKFFFFLYQNFRKQNPTRKKNFSFFFLKVSFNNFNIESFKSNSNIYPKPLLKTTFLFFHLPFLFSFFFLFFIRVLFKELLQNLFSNLSASIKIENLSCEKMINWWKNMDIEYIRYQSVKRGHYILVKSYQIFCILIKILSFLHWFQKCWINSSILKLIHFSYLIKSFLSINVT